MSRDYLDLGDWNAACAECGRKRKASELKRLPPGVPGAGMYVCPEHWDARHPQEFVRGIPDKPAAPWVQQQTDSGLFAPIEMEDTADLVASYVLMESDSTPVWMEN